MNVGFVGLGTMGAPMARNVLRAGFALTVHNRTRDRELALEAEGARRAASPAEASSGADVVVVIVSGTSDVEDVLFGPGGVASGAGPGTVVVDMSTISPSATRVFGERLAAGGVRMVDAPVSGGVEGAGQGTLTVMAGGAADDVERVRPVLLSMGRTVTHVGPAGAGQATKAVNQVIVGGYYLALTEGLLLARRLGLDTGVVVEAIGAGACRSWMLEHRARSVLEPAVQFGFRLALHRKDAGIVLDEARAAGMRLPLTALVAALEDEALRDGDGDLSALARVIEPGAAPEA